MSVWPSVDYVIIQVFVGVVATCFPLCYLGVLSVCLHRATLYPLVRTVLGFCISVAGRQLPHWAHCTMASLGSLGSSLASSVPVSVSAQSILARILLTWDDVAPSQHGDDDDKQEARRVLLLRHTHTFVAACTLLLRMLKPLCGCCARAHERWWCWGGGVCNSCQMPLHLVALALSPC